MRAAVLVGAGGTEVIEVREVPTPEPVLDQVLVRVRASALNRADVLQRMGRYPAPPDAPANIPGIEFAGEVAAIGPSVTSLSLGARVFGIAGGGCHAEYVLVRERTAARIPDDMSWEDAGAIPEAFITAHDALWIQAALRPNERVLIHAVGSGVGLAAVQLVRAIGAIPYGTARTPEKIEEARGIGLEDGVAVSGDFSILAEAVGSWTAGKGMDVVLELVGGDYLPASLAALGQRGRLMLVGTLAGQKAEIDLSKILVKRLRITGTVLRSRPIEEKITATRAFEAEVVPLFSKGVLRANVDRVYELDDIRAAHEHMESNTSFGKVVINVGD